LIDNVINDNEAKPNVVMNIHVEQFSKKAKSCFFEKSFGLRSLKVCDIDK